MDQYRTKFKNQCDNLYEFPPRDWQVDVGSTFIGANEENREIRMLCVQGTGSGKSLLYQTLATYFKGVTLYISPLLALGTDQCNKLMTRTRGVDETIIPILLDECKNDWIAHQIYSDIEMVDHNDNTIVLFTSPQFITERNPAFIRFMNSFICFVVLDELHLFNSFGRSFRNEFPQLKEKIFDKFPLPIPMLALTATCTSNIKSSVEDLIGKNSHIPTGQCHQICRIGVQAFILPIRPVRSGMLQMYYGWSSRYQCFSR